MQIQLSFEHAEYISIGAQPDELLVIFSNTSKYLSPKNEDFQVIPDGFFLRLPIP